MSRWDAVESLLLEAVGPVFPAAELLVVDAGTQVYAQRVGADKSAHLFDVASLTKALSTTVLVMQLLDEGRLALDDEVRPGVTVRHLLEHSAGLPPWVLLAPRPFASSVREAIIDCARQTVLDNPPGRVARYSDLGFILLGAYVEQRGGAMLDELFAKRVASRLGVGTRFLPPDPDDCLPTEGDLRGEVHDENCRAMDGVAGHAGLFSSASDVSTIAAALVDAWHGRTQPDWPRPETVRRFWQPSAVSGSTWCMGWDRPSPTHSSAGDRWSKDGVGHLGFTGCSLWIDPPRRRWVVLLSNRIHPTRTNERIKELRPVLHDAVSVALD